MSEQPDARFGRPPPPPPPKTNQYQPCKDQPRKPTTRSACDRCHSQKLRCSRQGNAETPCERCLRLGAVCVYGESRRMGRPRESNPQANQRSLGSQIGSQNYNSSIEQSQGGESFDVLPSRELSLLGQFEMQAVQQQLEWSEDRHWTPGASNQYIATPDLDRDLNIHRELEDQRSLLPPAAEDPSPRGFMSESTLSRRTSLVTSPWDPAMGLQSVQNVYFGGSPSFENLLTRDIGESIHQLSELQVSLYRSSRAVSSIIINQGTMEMGPLTANTSSSSSPFHPQRLQNTPSTELQSIYDASQRFLEIVNGLMRMLQGKTTNATQPSTTHPLAPSLAQAEYSNALPWPFPSVDDPVSNQQVDSATVVLVSSCYMRLIFIYRTLVEKLDQKCRGSVSTDIPSSMRVEPFSSSSSDMQVVLLLQFVSHLFGRVGKAMERFISTTDNANGVSIGELQRKEEELREMFGRVRTLLDESDSTEL